ncbi:MAG: DUF6438 domain-containing protein [Saprospiraceae bacterium]
MKYPLFCILVAAMAVACNAQKSAPAQQPNSTTTTTNLIRLEMGSCRGYCPVYKLTFRTDGTLQYEGTRHVEKLGGQTVKLTADEFSRLQNEVRRADLWQYPAEFPSTVADAPSHTFTVFENTKTHSVKGTAGIPKPIMLLEGLMQDIAEAHGIQVKKGLNPNDPSTLKGEVLVKFKMEVNAGNFCMQFTEIKVRPLRHISENNIWLIGFDPSQLTETQFIDLLKSMEGVLEVQPNNQVKERN